jgi:K+-sensing histidine kinase KdpD
MEFNNPICRQLAVPLTMLHGNLEMLADEDDNLKESPRYKEIMNDMEDITQVFREIQKSCFN